PVRVWRRGPDDFLLLTEPELGEVVRAQLLRSRFAARCEIALEPHTSALVFGEADGLPGEVPGTVEVLDAGLDETHVSFTKGCYPGQEPIARLRHRGHVNRRLRVLEVESARAGDDVLREERVVGRVTSAVPGLALGYVRTDVPDDAKLSVGGANA